MIRTLIVEDNPVFRQTLRRLLSTHFSFMSFAEASDGYKAFASVHAFNPHIVFMDIKLPDEKGLELTRRIKTSFDHVIVIVLTSYDLPEYRSAPKESGADYFVSKGSATPAEILEMVSSILAEVTKAKKGKFMKRSGTDICLKVRLNYLFIFH